MLWPVASRSFSWHPSKNRGFPLWPNRCFPLRAFWSFEVLDHVRFSIVDCYFDSSLWTTVVSSTQLVQTITTLCSSRRPCPAARGLPTEIRQAPREAERRRRGAGQSDGCAAVFYNALLAPSLWTRVASSTQLVQTTTTLCSSRRPCRGARGLPTEIRQAPREAERRRRGAGQLGGCAAALYNLLLAPRLLTTVVSSTQLVQTTAILCRSRTTTITAWTCCFVAWTWKLLQKEPRAESF